MHKNAIFQCLSLKLLVRITDRQLVFIRQNDNGIRKIGRADWLSKFAIINVFFPDSGYSEIDKDPERLTLTEKITLNYDAF